MKTRQLLKKSLTVIAATVLTLVMIISAMPAALAAGEPQTGTGETLAASNISISGEIKMTYYFTGIDESAYGNNYYVRVTIPQPDDQADKVIDTKVSSLDKDNRGRWIVPVSLPYAQQTDEFTIQFFKNGTEGKVRTRSVKAYADTVLNLAKTDERYERLVAPITNMLNVGAMAQTAFGHNTSNLANAGLFGDANPIDNMLPEHFYDLAAAPEHSDTVPEIEFLGCSAVLESKIALRIYVDCPDSVTTATISDGKVEREVNITKNGDKKYVKVSNIAATSFNTRYSVTLTYNGVSESYAYSVLDYAVAALKSPTVSAEQKNLARALYPFYTQTTKYMEPSYTVGPKTAPCEHERTYTNKDSVLVCPDCDTVWIQSADAEIPTKINVASAVNGNTVTLTFSISGDSTPLSGIVFTPECGDENVTFTLMSYEANGLNVTADKNLVVLNQSGALNGETLLTATYTVTAPAGPHKISVDIREATGENNEDIDVSALLTGIAIFEAN